MMKFYYAYVLQSKKTGTLYKGSSGDLQQRLYDHNRGKVTATKPRMPWKLVYYEALPSKKRAQQRERYFKTSWGLRFIKKQIADARAFPS